MFRSADRNRLAHCLRMRKTNMRTSVLLVAVVLGTLLLDVIIGVE